MKLAKLFPIVILLAALAAGVYLSRKVQETRRGAAAYDTVTVSFLPDTKTLNVGETVITTVVVDAKTHKLTGVDLGFKYDQTKLRAVAINPIVGEATNILFDASSNVVDKNIYADRGVIMLRGISMRMEDAARATGVVQLARITFEAIAAGSVQVDIDRSRDVAGSRGNMAVRFIASGVDPELSYLEVEANRATYTINGGGTVTATPTPRSGACRVTKNGDVYTAVFTRTDAGKLWITRKDGGMVGNSSLGLGSTRVYNNAPPNYLYVAGCSGGCTSELRQTVTGLAPGDYYLHCGSDQPTESLCSGNPWCDYEKQVNPSLPGGLPCTGYRSCWTEDNLAFTISGQQPTVPPPTGGVGGCQVTKNGNEYTATFNGARSGRLWITRKDGLAMGETSLGLGATRAYAPDYIPNYLYLGSCGGSSTRDCTTGIRQTVTNLRAGEYYVHCDVSESANGVCSGNPFCGYEKDANSLLPGGLPCTGYRSCSTSDNVGFTIGTGPTPTPVGAVTFDLRTEQTTVRVGQTFVVIARAQTGSNRLSAVRMIPSFTTEPGGIMGFEGVSPVAGVGTANMEFVTDGSVPRATTGEIDMTLINSSPAHRLCAGSCEVVAMVFRAVAVGSGQFDYGGRTSSQAVGVNGQGISGAFTVAYGSPLRVTVESGPVGTCKVCPNGVPAKGRGNANCDEAIDPRDFEAWRSEALDEGGVETDSYDWDANFNCPLDLKVSAADRDIWRRGYLNISVD